MVLPLLAFLWLLLAQALPLSAQTADIEIDGLIINQTKSKPGQDFVCVFSSLWETGATGYNIVMDEQYDVRAGSWLTIEINGELVYKTLLKPNAAETENLASEAVAYCEDFLQARSEANENLEQEKDLRGDGIH
ncbi:CsgE family curli-type amyloid fiber assembly protein [Geomonas anaerohicana]|uniref:Curli production assembly/transport component CsgE n=1 Tax=Geomonas anaerohicana TaxID=2798583 RepID=A0ABS0YC94_9BACT|nr:CsgE family curli-type amyloid fiber assembly protein [Geomonas anaerohicana]MBJ6749915.1 hypothetical protein [Geomonas anaerohicana]